MFGLRLDSPKTWMVVKNCQPVCDLGYTGINWTGSNGFPPELDGLRLKMAKANVPRFDARALNLTRLQEGFSGAELSCIASGHDKPMLF